MKTRLIILFTLSVLCNISAHAELEYFFPHSGGYINIGLGCIVARHSFEGDTIIQDKVYTKIYTYHCYSETECSQYRFYFAAMRQDTINEKIYGILTGTEEEKLIADFGVEVGDEVTVYSFPIGSSGFEITNIVQEVDHIQIGDQLRKSVKVSRKGGPPFVVDTWVEGIGSIDFGFLYPCQPRMMDANIITFLCLQTDDGFEYKNPLYNTCYYTYSEYEDCSSGILYNEVSPFAVYPTLADKYLLIRKDMEKYTYQLYNIQGIIMDSGILESEQIDVTTLNSGLYFILFYDKDGRKVYAQKFIKQ